MNYSSSTSSKASWSFSGSFSISGWTSTSDEKPPPRRVSRNSGSAPALPSFNVPDDASTSTPTRSHSGPENGTQNGPRIDAPFDFSSSDSSDLTVLECSDSDEESDQPRLIAIPQTSPLNKSPFQTGYPPSLHSHGISKATWASFLDTVSAFMEATVSEQAINHAMDIATQVGKRPKKLATNVVSRTMSIGQEIGDSAKRGNLFGVATGVIKGTVSIPLNVVMSTATGVLGLPITAALAASKKPSTGRQRATAYVAVANDQWLVKRGLYAGILDTKELGDLLGVPMSTLPVVEEVDENGVTSEETQFSILEDHVEDLETWGESSAQIGAGTLWLVLTRVS